MKKRRGPYAKFDFLGVALDYLATRLANEESPIVNRSKWSAVCLPGRVGRLLSATSVGGVTT